MEGPYALVYPSFVRRALDKSGKRPREARDHVNDLADRVLRRRFRKFSEAEVGLFKETLQLIR